MGSSEGNSSSSPTAPPPDSLSPPPPPPSSDSPSPKSSPSPPPPSNSGSTPSTDYSPPRPVSSNGIKAPPPPKSSSSSTTTVTPASTSSSGTSSGGTSVYIGIGLAVGLLLVALAILCVGCCCRKRKKRRDEYYSYNQGGDQYYNSSQQQQSYYSAQNPDQQNSGWGPPPPPMMNNSGDMSSNFSGPHRPHLPPPSPPTMSVGFNQSTFTYDDLATATGGFAQSNLLGQGGFGYVHKGVLPNGKVIAVKSLKTGSGQGEREFQAEVEIISRVHHRHLVSLVGYCIAGGQRMLVYEFVPNGTMEYHLHGKGRPTMDWPSRLRIAMGSAKGLAYLHEDCHPRIIHRDIKAANILLDNNFEAMVADFGLAKLSSDNYTHVSTRVMGTFGYLAPEYASSGKLSEKSDVFSFGVMLLELITGKRPVDNMHMEDSLVDWARPLLTKAIDDGNYSELVDFRLESNFDPQEMARMLSCASASIRHSARKRPKMSQIVRALEGDVSLNNLNGNEGGNQTAGNSSVYSSSTGSSDTYDTRMYNSDMEKFRKIALSSQEFTSSELTATSSSTDSR